MSVPANLAFLNSQTIGNLSCIEAIFRLFIDGNFEIINLKIGKKNVDIQLLENDYLNTLKYAHESQHISFTAFNSQTSFEFSQYIIWGRNYLETDNRSYIGTLTDNPNLHQDGEVALRYSSLFLELGRKMYAILQPDIGWLDFTDGVQTTHEDIENLEVKRIEWANFFGPKFVKHVGHEIICAAPAWKVESLSDGGLLYLLAPHMGITDEHVSIDDVKQYFGIESVRA